MTTSPACAVPVDPLDHDVVWGKLVPDAVTSTGDEAATPANSKTCMMTRPLFVTEQVTVVLPPLQPGSVQISHVSAPTEAVTAAAVPQLSADAEEVSDVTALALWPPMHATRQFPAVAGEDRV